MPTYYIDEGSGSAYWKEGKEVRFSPLLRDGSFEKDEGGIVEVWDELDRETILANI